MKRLQALWWKAAVAASILLSSGGRPRAMEVPSPGGLQSLAAERTEPVALINGGFEDGAGGWSAKPSFSVASGQGHSGKASLRFRGSPAKEPVPSVKQALSHLGPGVYTLRFWVKMSGIASASKPGGLRIPAGGAVLGPS
jgi:hypothetical protein